MNLSQYLAESKIKPSAFALELGVEASTVSRWLHGERTPSLELMQRITVATQGAVTASDFLDPASASSSRAADNSPSSV